MKFLVRNYSCLQNPLLGGYRPQIPILCPLSSTEFVEPPPNKIPGYATDFFQNLPCFIACETDSTQPYFQCTFAKTKCNLCEV